MRVFTPDEVIVALAKNAKTGVFFNRQGQVVELLQIEQELTPHSVVDIAKQRKEAVFRFVVRGTYTTADLEGWARDAVEAFELSEQGKLRPGANCFGP